MIVGPRYREGSILTEIRNKSVIQFDEISDSEMENLIDGTITDIEEGELVIGTIVKIEHDEVLLDIGFKSEGVIPARELSIRDDVDTSEIVSLGDEIEALVIQKEDKDGRLLLSKKRAEYKRAWNSIEEKFHNGETVEGEVIEVVKGGLILDIGLRGFLPASLVDLRRVKDLNSFLGTIIEARVIEMDRNRNNVVLSRRILLEEGRKSERAEILGKLEKGMRLKGNISSIVEFGAFVDLGGIDGLVHISELSWSHVNHPSEVVSVGDEVEVEVLDVDRNRERISLGLKQTTEDPWRALIKNYPVDSVVEGAVTKIVPFGVFVALCDGVEGLVHISEMANKHVNHPSQVVEVGQTVPVKVMSIDLDRRRISLSIKAAAEQLGIDIEVKELQGEEGKAADKAEEAEGAEVAEVAEAVESAEVAEAVESAEAAEVIENAEATDAAEAIEDADADETVEPAQETAADQAAVQESAE